MSGKTLVFVGGAAVLVIAVVGGFALLHDDGEPSRPKLHVTNPVPEPTATPKVALHPGGPGELKSPTSTGSKGPQGKASPKAGAPAKRTAAVTPVHPRVVAGPGGGPVVIVRGPDNQPVADAVVEASTARGGPLPPRPTNAQGEARLDALPPNCGKVTGKVRHPRFSEEPTFSCDPGTDHVEVRFAAAATGVLTGTIRDARGHAPPACQLTVIDVNGLETDLESSTFASYDAGSGRFRVELAPGSYTVKASAQGFCPSDLSYPTVVLGQDSTMPDLVLEVSASITGRVQLPPDLQVQTQQGQLTLNFDLQCVRGDPQNPNTTIKHLTLPVDQDGNFTIPDLQSGMYRVRAGDGQRVGAWAAAKIDEGGQATVSLTLQGGDPMPSVRGVLRDSRGGLVAGARVATPLATVYTDQSGAFELKGLDPGTVQLTIDKDGFQTLTTQITVAGPGQNQSDIMLVLNARGSAAGRVTRRGAPAGGVSVLVVQKTDGGGVKTYGPVTTDATGGWQLNDLDQGHYYLKVGNTSDVWSDAGAPTFDVQAGETAQVPPVEVP